MASRSSKSFGWTCLGLWAALIMAGIIAKRVYGHPDLMVFFHLPAAVFLVLAFYDLSKDVRERYRRSFIVRERLTRE